MKFNLIFLFVFTGICFISCKKKEPTKASISRLDKALMQCKSEEDIRIFLQQNKSVSEFFYHASPEDTSLIRHLYTLVKHAETQKLYQQTATYFGDLSDIEQELSEAFDRIQSFYPNFKRPKVYAAFSALENDIFVSDSLVIISLESFLGKKALYRPQHPNYILLRYQKPYIIPSIVRFLSARYNPIANNDRSLLTEMIGFGKAFTFTKTMLPETADSLIVAYPDSSMYQTHHAQDLIWAHFIDNQLLYSTNPRIKEKYIGERPNVYEIGPACPGRIGQWLGWQIVQKYQKETDTPLTKLMENTDARQILEASKYRGEIDE